MYLIIKYDNGEKASSWFLGLLSILVVYELFEITMISLGVLFMKEIPLDIGWDLIIGMLGGLFYFIININNINKG